ncbi:MAG: protein arginine kinase [Oscillospiraceae bacterium]|nr:protein arginine kinase [Oscillospiraceae bacterium]
MDNFGNVNKMDNNVVISTRIRLARNLKDYPFPCRLNETGMNEVNEKIRDALLQGNSAIAKDFQYIDFEDMSDTMKVSLVEKHLVSPEFISNTKGRALLLLNDGTVGIMLNEEDHIRLQIIEKGFCLEKTYDLADKIDTLLDEHLSFAFDEKLGYLTQCPTNIGTGMRASVMLHLPALKKSGAMNMLAGNLNKLGLTIRGTYGEGTASEGAIYQLSNQVSLGISEKAAIENLKNVTIQLVNQEVKQRETLVKSIETKDTVMRSLGLLKNACLMTHKEAVNLLSNVRFGICAGLIKDVDLEKINDLITEIQPATLMTALNKHLSPKDRDIKRADYIREKLK